MLKTTVLALLLGAQAHAKTECYTLLRFAPPAQPVANAELAAAREWLQGLRGSPAGFEKFLEGKGINENTLSEEQRKDLAATYTLEQWNLWRSANETQRDAALGLELRKLSPSDGRVIYEFNPNTQITRLSAANRTRLLERFKQIYPATQKASSEQTEAAKRMAQDLMLHFMRPRQVTVETGVSAPLASPRELHHFGLSEKAESFYSALVGESPSVGFDVVASRVDQRTYNLGAQVAQDAVRLEDAFAAEYAFMLPRLDNAIDLMNLMAKWDPSALEDLLIHLRFSLPSYVRNVRDLQLYLAPDKINQVFPNASLAQRMEPLRLRLKGFLMTEQDGVAFLRDAFEHFLLAQDATIFRDLTAKWKRLGGAQAVFKSDFLPALGWSGVSMRVPVSVPPQNYNIVRSEGMAGRPDFDGGPHQPRWDSRRLDRQAMP